MKHVHIFTLQRITRRKQAMYEVETGALSATFMLDVSTALVVPTKLRVSVEALDAEFKEKLDGRK